MKALTYAMATKAPSRKQKFPPVFVIQRGGVCIGIIERRGTAESKGWWWRNPRDMGTTRTYREAIAVLENLDDVHSKRIRGVTP